MLVSQVQCRGEMLSFELSPTAFAGLRSEVSVLGIYQDVPSYVELIDLYRGHGFELSGAYVVNRLAPGSLIIEMDMVFASVPD